MRHGRIGGLEYKPLKVINEVSNTFSKLNTADISVSVVSGLSNPGSYSRHHSWIG